MNASAPIAGEDVFGSLVAPVSTALFFERYFEREVLHVARGERTYFSGLYSVRCVEDALVIGAHDLDRFALIKHAAGAVAPEALASKRSAVPFRSAREPSRSVIDSRSVVAAFADGFTLNIRDASAYHPPLARLCNQIQFQLGFYTRANVYLTPPGAQGFELHSDAHDTLSVQIEGEKTWQVYDPQVPLPLEAQSFSPGGTREQLGTPRTIRLQAGDSLYIPHGFAHAAVTAAHRSLHLTFAISPIRAIDLIDALTQLAARDNVDLRRALPPGWHRDPGFAARFGARIAELMPQALALERIPRAAEAAYDELFAATRTVAAGAFDTLAAFQALRSDSRIRLRDDTPFQLRDRGERLDVVLAAKVVSVPAAARAGFARLEQGPAAFAELDGVLPFGTGSAFVRTLVLEGLVSVDE